VKVGLLSQRQLSSLDDHLSKQQQHLPPPPLSATTTRLDLILFFPGRNCVLHLSVFPYWSYLMHLDNLFNRPGCQDQVIASKRQTGRALVTQAIARLAFDLRQSKVIACVVVHLR
jgi:hypothetical protein